MSMSKAEEWLPIVRLRSFSGKKKRGKATSLGRGFAAPLLAPAPLFPLGRVPNCQPMDTTMVKMKC